jgi:RNase P subunit RPR2
MRDVVQSTPAACQDCHQPITPGLEVVAVKHIGRSTIQLVFCCEGCANRHYLDLLNRSGFEAAPCDFDFYH